ncbi:MAG: diaminopimelate epimerase [Bacteroidota bacterium]
MKLTFYKYEGTGNDFILIDNRKKVFDPSRLDLVRSLCHRRFGIGSDGLMLLQDKEGYDFEMIFYNPDGSQSLCGNGSRCIVAFASLLGIIRDKAHFVTFDGEHEALILPDSSVSLKMNDVQVIEKGQDFYFLNTGSPHYCAFVNGISGFDVVGEGRKIRYSERFKAQGTNVNFLEKKDNAIIVRTYERGVENETLSCGTGVTAAALTAAYAGILENDSLCHIRTPGGDLKVKFKRAANGSFTDIWLEGPAVFVYKGEIEID